MIRLCCTLLALALAVNGPASTQTPVATRDTTRDYTPADVAFMTGMIHHHAQALLIAGWAPSHGASADVQTLCERIVAGQKDEIAIMGRWLAERGEPVPHIDPQHMRHGLSDQLMPGMLTAEQLAQLDGAGGPQFDELFLRFMIQHHEGALTMVEQLIGSAGAAQDDTVFKLAADISADQTAEIDRMHVMLAALPPRQGSRTP